jgi:hypothetical protein
MSSAHSNLKPVQGLAVQGISKITNVFSNQIGPLPLTGVFQSSGGSFLIFVSGSLSTSQKDTRMVMDIFLDTNKIGTAQEWTNPSGSHASLVPVLLTVPPQIVGNHVVELRVASANTNSDFNDFYNVTVIELKP